MLLVWAEELLVFELWFDGLLLLFVLWIGSQLMLARLDSELVLLLSELEIDGELGFWLLLVVASIFGGGINCLLS